MAKVSTFTCISKGVGAQAIPGTREKWESLRKEPWLADMCRRVELGQQELKLRMPIWTPHCAEFRNNHRSNSDALRPLNRLMLDFDEKGHTDEIVERIEGGENPLMKQAGLKLLLIEESVRRGTHVLVELPQGMSAEEAQQLMAIVTGFKPDEAVKDVSRCIFMVSDDHTRFVSDRLFEVDDDEEESPNSSEQSDSSASAELSFKGIPYSAIIKEWWMRNGGEPAEGERNVKLHRLAVNLRTICDNKKEVLLRVMPRLGLSETEMGNIVESACKETPRGMSKAMQEIVKSLESAVRSASSGADGEQSPEWNFNVKHLPVGLRESLVGVPENMYLPVLCAVLPIAGAYADQVEVEYCDGNLQKLGLMSIIVGDQASGKSVCKNAIDEWKCQMTVEDREARKREEEWKQRKLSRKANEKAPEDPKVVIREVPVTVSCSTLLRRLKNAKGHTLYSFGEELDTLRKTNGAGSWSSKYDIYRLSFDHGEWGQDYNSDQAESGVVNVSYNFTVLGTYGALYKCFKTDNIENGLSSRVLIAEMPDSSFAKMPRYGRRTDEDKAAIQTAVSRLRATTGYLDTPRLRKRIDRWEELKRQEAAKDIDRVKDTYRKRAGVIGFRAGVIFHILEGTEEESLQCVKFAEMIAEYCLKEQMKLFGDSLQSQFVNAAYECQRYGKNHSVYDQLPPVFTMNDLRSLKNGTCGESALRNITTRWNKDGWVEKVDYKHWRKVDNRRGRKG